MGETGLERNRSRCRLKGEQNLLKIDNIHKCDDAE